MRKVLLLAFVTLFASGLVHAHDYAVLCANSNHTVCSWSGGDFTMYVFSYMRDHEMDLFEFKCVFPAFATPGAVTNGPDSQSSIGDITYDLSVMFNDCHSGWWLICSVPITYTGGVGVITITDPDPRGEIYLAVSDCNYNMWRLAVGTYLFLGQPCPVNGTQDATWGAIRSLF